MVYYEDEYLILKHFVLRKLYNIQTLSMLLGILFADLLSGNFRKWEYFIDDLLHFREDIRRC